MFMTHRAAWPVLALAALLYLTSTPTGFALPVNDCGFEFGQFGECIDPGDRSNLNDYRSVCRTTATLQGYTTGIVLSAELIELGAGPPLFSQCNTGGACGEPGEELFECLGINLRGGIETSTE